MCYVMLVANYIAVRQCSIAVQLERLIEIVQRHRKRGRRKRRQSRQLLDACVWSTFLHANHSLARVATITARYTAHCSTLLSLIAPYYIIPPCYLLYALLFTDHSNGEGDDLTIFVMTSINNNCLLFFTIQQCSRVVGWNRRLERTARRFYAKRFIMINPDNHDYESDQSEQVIRPSECGGKKDKSQCVLHLIRLNTEKWQWVWWSQIFFIAHIPFLVDYQ